ncbi:MAG TPA: alpha/beta hydrolase [Kofleriaceae bacterium]|nr:alpha/beta hydrolase [Kofleriaceae bacterium]
MITRWILPVAGLWSLALGGCPRFHTAPPPGAPKDARFVDALGTQIHYVDVGSGPAVLLLHGYGSSLRSWETVIPVLAEHHRVIAIDLKGFGWSGRPPGDYSPATQANIALAVLDARGVKDVAVVGHSWGASVALAVALAAPDRVRRIALYDAYVYDAEVPSMFQWSQLAGIGEVLFGLYYTERLEDKVPLAFYDPTRVPQAVIDRLAREMARPGTVAAALATARGHRFFAVQKRYPSITVPVLLLWGKDDIITPLRFGRRLVSELPDARLIVYPRCGHIPMIEAQRASTRDLAAFLDGDRP